MGTWSAEPFGNDTAADWAYELEDHVDWGIVSAALHVVADSDPSRLDADDATVAVAAAEVVARGLGRVKTPAFSEHVEAYIARAPRPTVELVALAHRAVAIATSEAGELAELWEGDADWLSENERLRAALTTG
ncbi:DUF4259 domain-containing protein [Microbacterium sp. VKM Ac-2923]|uniref:DUF4259 domain-containing protein n=1 Tax=Microbacterium sp. VKM Ac-2923 TaxID=2929476 RepID=UPI001FB28CD9|nr:DUF4259 domain-containing protein [Microbacterium sp. VKM Ac-2923]MCJ1708899.1 DUF4259 domain-containing protein [Microbacterium sp. VKM Ac-2923]